MAVARREWQIDRPVRSGMGEMVLLHHVDGAEEHWDWLLERDVPSGACGFDRRLIAFRVNEPLDPTRVAEFAATRIGDHRAVYLEYEGPLPAPGGSPRAAGTVQRVWRGSCRVDVEAPTRLELTVTLDGRIASFAGEAVDLSDGGGGEGGRAWWFTRV